MDLNRPSEEVPIPRPGPGEVLARVEAASVDFTDRKVFLRGHHPMITVPGLFGHEWTGTIAEAGAGVEDSWRPGQRVAAANSVPCLPDEGPVCRQCRRGRPSMCENIQYVNGAFAPYILVPARLVKVNLHPVAADVPLERMVFTEPYACVLHAVRRIPVHPGETVVVLGAAVIAGELWYFLGPRPRPGAGAAWSTGTGRPSAFQPLRCEQDSTALKPLPRMNSSTSGT